MYSDYDFIMLEYDVPLKRNPDTDMIIIKKIPHNNGYNTADRL
jgi:hypothetical protein